MDAIAHRLTHGSALDLSPKFGVLVDSGGAVHVRGRRHDVALGATRDEHGTVRYEVQLAGPLPLRRPPGPPTWSVAADQVPTVVDAVIESCATFGRVDAWLDATGPDRAVALLRDRTGGALTDEARLAEPRGVSRSAVGVYPQRQADLVWVGVSPILARVSADSLAALADLADSAGAAELRVTPWGGLLLPHVARADASAVVDACERRGMVADPTHPAATVVACAGRRGCAAGQSDTQADARRLVDRLAQLPADRRPASVHVSGCDKGCARPHPASVTLVAGAAAGTYDLYADRPDPAPHRFGILLRSGLEPDDALDAVATLESTP